MTAPKPRPIDPAALRQRRPNGSYPFLNHRTCAEWSPRDVEVRA